MKKIIQTIAMPLIFGFSFAQESVTMVVNTDDYGYEGYWEIVSTGNPCGTGTVASGGNTAVGCSGAGVQAQTPGGYGNNLTVNEGPWILTTGAQYDLIYADDWGDGGFAFDIIINGFQSVSFEGIGLGGTYTFTVENPPAYDLSVFGSNLYSYVTTGVFDIDAHVFNTGTTTITSYDLNYMVDGGTVYTHPVTTNLANFGSEAVTHNTPLNISSNGVYEVKIWTDNFNGGNADLNNLNDTLTKLIEAGPGRPNYIDGYINEIVTIDQVAGSSNQISSPTDLDFHPVLTNQELWVINKGTENSGGSTVTINNAGEAGQTSLYKQDGNAYHFMSLPTGIAFSQNGNWANSPGVYDANHDGGSAFTGPALWSSDMSLYAQPSGGNGSHLDMLHVSPNSQGIAAENENVFWVFDGYTSDIVRYDFAEDHGPGNDFHGDAIIRRYSDDVVTMDPTEQAVSHLVLDEAQQWLYVVDNGNQRVIRIDITTGSDAGGAPNYPQTEAVIEYSEFTGYTQEDVVTGLDRPAGIDVIDNRMIVSEYGTGEIIIYDISVMPAVELERISTSLSSVQGIKIGPKGRIWFVDQNTNGVYKLETATLNVEELNVEFNVYPNPSSGEINIFTNSPFIGKIEVLDVTGKLIHEEIISGQTSSINLNATPGVYFINMVNDNVKSETKRIIIK
tara:strand:- start:334 stop:2355 length:2022 start_codon:yes stop_codon:yes gene_type:complete